MNRLAGLFFHNWVKTPGEVFDLSKEDGFAPGLEQFGCTVNRLPLHSLLAGEQRTKAAAVSIIGGFETLRPDQAACLLANIRKAIDPEGILFIRVEDESEWNLFKFLAVLDLDPTFAVVETYKVDAARDYLLRPIEKRPTVCIGMIAKNEERDLPRCLHSLDGVADGIVLLDTGSVDKTLEVAREWAARQQERDPAFRHDVDVFHAASEQDEHGDWKLWNFSMARNQYVERIEAMGFDYVLWMDADDEVLDPDRLKLIRYLAEYDAQGVMMQDGNLRWPHYRLLKTRRGVHYEGWCHEFPTWTGPSFVHEDITIRHDAAAGIGEGSNERNQRILEREMAAKPNARTAFYLACAFKDSGRPAEAVPHYKVRMDFGKDHADEYWFAALYKARCERLSGQHDECRKTVLSAVQERPDWAEFWMELAYLESGLGNHDRAIGWAYQAKDRPIVPTQLFRERSSYTDQPYRVISWSHEHKGDLAQALHWGELARDRIGQHDQEWEDRLQHLRERSSKKRVVWHRPGALGDVLMTLNLVKLYKEKHPDTEVIYQAHESVTKLLKSVMLQAGADEVVDTDTEVAHEQEYRLVGYPIHEGYPERPMGRHLLEYFSLELGLEGEVAALQLPRPKPKYKRGDYLSLHVKPGWSPYKQWDIANWAWVVERCREHGIPVVQIGGPDDPPIRHAENFLGLPMEESMGMIGNAKLHAGIDSWSNHATNIEWEGKGKTPGVILWGSTQVSAAGYSHNTNISKGLACQPCFKEDPKISAQPRGPCSHHSCMKAIQKEEVLEAILDKWRS